MVYGTCFFLCYILPRRSHIRKTTCQLPQCCWMPPSEEAGALVLFFFLDVAGFVCHAGCVFLFSVQCSHRCGWFLTRGCSVKSVSDCFFCLERCLGCRVFGAKLEENRDSYLTSQHKAHCVVIRGDWRGDSIQFLFSRKFHG